MFQSPHEAKATLLRLYEKRRREGSAIRMKDYRNFKLAGLPHFVAKELTTDHHPDRVTDWEALTGNDSYLVAVSDGVLEKLGTQDVCDLLWDLHIPAPLELQYSPSCSYSLADCIIDTALERGSMDNVAAVVAPFGLQNLSTVGSRVQNYVDRQSSNFTL
ncbi:putative protein phosphatase 2C family, PPM-type phosphatase domain superfamily [Helianthus anomalus]